MTGQRPGGHITPTAKYTTTGYQWQCLNFVPDGRGLPTECDGSDGGFEEDFLRIWKEARAHKDQHPDHKVVVDRWQRATVDAPGPRHPVATESASGAGPAR